MHIRAGSILVILLILLTLAGCDSPFRDEAADDWRRGDPLRWRVEDNMTEHRGDTLAIAASEADESFSADAGPEDYVKLALARNPSILAARRRVERMAEEIPQVTSLDDPMLQVSPPVGSMPETAAGMVGVMTMVSQQLPFPGKLDTRGRIAAQEAAMAQRELESEKLAVAADVRRAYWSLYLTQRQIEVSSGNRELLSQLHRVAMSKYEAGTASQQDVLRASVELSDLDNQIITLRQRQRAAKGMLNSLMDRGVDAPLPVPSEAKLSEVSLKLDELLAEAAKSNPRLRRAHDNIEAYRQRLKLARLNRWPDLNVSLTYNTVDRSDMAPMSNGKDQWWFGFGVNLPIWQGRRDAEERGALAGVMEGVAELTAAQNRLAFETQDAMLKVETQQRSAILFRDVIIPRTQQAAAVSQSAYQAGTSDFLTLVENWRQVLSFELMYHQSVTEMQQNLAQLQQVIGRQVQP